MKFSIIALTGLVALAASQDATTASLSPQASCATKCDPKDTCCNAACYNVPCPDAAMANDTTACAAACPQGSGTPDDTAAYAKCQQSCYSSLFFPGTATLPPVTGSAATATATSTDGSNIGSHSLLSGTVDSHGGSAQRTGSSTSGSSDSSPTSTATGSKTSATETGAASHIGIQLGVAGVFGAIMAAFFL